MTTETNNQHTQIEAERAFDAAWSEYANKSALLANGVAPDPAKTQTAYFAFQYAWLARFCNEWNDRFASAPSASSTPSDGVEWTMRDAFSIFQELTEALNAIGKGHKDSAEIARIMLRKTDKLHPRFLKAYRAALAATPSEGVGAGDGEMEDQLKLAKKGLEAANNVMNYCHGDAWERACTDKDRDAFYYIYETFFPPEPHVNGTLMWEKPHEKGVCDVCGKKYFNVMAHKMAKHNDPAATQPTKDE